MVVHAELNLCGPKLAQPLAHSRRAPGDGSRTGLRHRHVAHLCVMGTDGALRQPHRIGGNPSPHLRGLFRRGGIAHVLHTLSDCGGGHINFITGGQLLKGLAEGAELIEGF